mmetsp:Transcript_9528/g.15305  ORF Transcript_9528/g.15305 Transcript_9528/m.15305 type:complete len:96 (-) Transcript_9528:795-1082(-)
MMVKQGFCGREKYSTLKEAVENCPIDIKVTNPSLLKRLNTPGLNIYKQVELYTQYCRIVPERFWANDLYRHPLDKILTAVKKEKKKRRHFGRSSV